MDLTRRTDCRASPISRRSTPRLTPAGLQSSSPRPAWVDAHQVIREVEQAHERRKMIIVARNGLTHQQFVEWDPILRMSCSYTVTIPIETSSPAAVAGRIASALRLSRSPPRRLRHRARQSGSRPRLFPRRPRCRGRRPSGPPGRPASRSPRRRGAPHAAPGDAWRAHAGSGGCHAVTRAVFGQPGQWSAGGLRDTRSRRRCRCCAGAARKPAPVAAQDQCRFTEPDGRDKLLWLGIIGADGVVGRCRVRLAERASSGRDAARRYEPVSPVRSDPGARRVFVWRVAGVAGESVSR